MKNRGDDHRGTRLVFRLDRRTPVRFTVFRVWPDCSRAGSFVRLGHRGRNAVRFSGRLRGHALAPGTYRIAIRPLRGARPGNVRRVTVVIVPPRQAVRTARAHRSVCGPPRGAEAQPGFAAAGGRGSGAVLASEHSGSSASEASSSGTAGGDDASGGSASQEAVAPPRGGGSSPDSAGPALGIFFVSVLAALLGLLAWGGWRTATGRGS